MKVYIIRGFTTRAYYDEWLNFGVYANRSDAEREMLKLAAKAFDSADKNLSGWHMGVSCKRKCEYCGGKLIGIRDDRDKFCDPEVNLTIDEFEVE